MWGRRKSTSRAEDDLPTSASTTAWITVGAIALGFVLLWLSTREWVPPWSASLLDELGGLLIAAIALAGLWEWRGRAAFTRDLLAKVNLSQEVVSSGIIGVGDYYLLNVPWTHLIDSSAKIDISMAYGETWRNANDAALRRFVARPGTRLRIILPDPRDADAVSEMARRFDYSTSEVQQKIAATTRAFLGYESMLGAESTVEVLFRRGIPTFTYYRFDAHLVFTMYSNRRDRTSEVPTIQVKGGRLGKFLRDDFQAMLDQSTAAELSVVTAKMRTIKSRAQ